MGPKSKFSLSFVDLIYICKQMDTQTQTCSDSHSAWLRLNEPRHYLNSGYLEKANVLFTNYQRSKTETNLRCGVDEACWMCGPQVSSHLDYWMDRGQGDGVELDSSIGAGGRIRLLEKDKQSLTKLPWGCFFFTDIGKYTTNLICKHCLRLLR